MFRRYSASTLRLVSCVAFVIALRFYTTVRINSEPAGFRNWTRPGNSNLDKNTPLPALFAERAIPMATHTTLSRLRTQIPHNGAAELRRSFPSPMPCGMSTDRVQTLGAKEITPICGMLLGSSSSHVILLPTEDNHLVTGSLCFLVFWIPSIVIQLLESRAYESND